VPREQWNNNNDNNGGSNDGVGVRSFLVRSADGSLEAEGASSPLRVSGLRDGVAYTFYVRARNDAGYGHASAPSLPVTARGLVPGAPSITDVWPGRFNQNDARCCRFNHYLPCQLFTKHQTLTLLIPSFSYQAPRLRALRSPPRTTRAPLH
jgi:hypothetical protein